MILLYITKWSRAQSRTLQIRIQIITLISGHDFNSNPLFIYLLKFVYRWQCIPSKNNNNNIAECWTFCMSLISSWKWFTFWVWFGIIDSAFFHHDLYLTDSTHFEPYSDAVDGCVYLPLSAYEFDETPVEYHNILNVVKNAKDREQSQSDHQSCERFAVDAGRCCCFCCCSCLYFG